MTPRTYLIQTCPSPGSTRGGRRGGSIGTSWWCCARNWRRCRRIRRHHCCWVCPCLWVVGLHCLLHFRRSSVVPLLSLSFPLRLQLLLSCLPPLCIRGSRTWSMTGRSGPGDAGPWTLRAEDILGARGVLDGFGRFLRRVRLHRALPAPHERPLLFIKIFLFHTNPLLLFLIQIVGPFQITVPVLCSPRWRCHRGRGLEFAAFMLPGVSSDLFSMGSSGAAVSGASALDRCSFYGTAGASCGLVIGCLLQAFKSLLVLGRRRWRLRRQLYGLRLFLAYHLIRIFLQARCRPVPGGARLAVGAGYLLTGCCGGCLRRFRTGFQSQVILRMDC